MKHQTHLPTLFHLLCVLWLQEASDSCTHLVSVAVQASVRRKFAALKHEGGLVLDDLIQLHTEDQILSACEEAGCSGHAAGRFADGLLK